MSDRFYSNLPIELFVAHPAIKRWLDQWTPHGPQHRHFHLKEALTVDFDPNVIPDDKLVVWYVTLQTIKRKDGAEIVDASNSTLLNDWHKRNAQFYSTSANDIMELYYGRHRQAFTPHHRHPLAGAYISPAGPIFTGVDPATGPSFGTFNFAGRSAGKTVRPSIATLNAWAAVISMLDDDIPKPLRTSGIVAAEIVGHRCWWVDSQKMLRSFIVSDFIWTPHEAVTGDVGKDGHDRGIHAYKDDTETARRKFFNYVKFRLCEECNNVHKHKDVHKFPALVFGRVKMWGDVIEHEHGYRSEFAKIVSLDRIAFAGPFLDWRFMLSGSPAAGNENLLSELRGTYGVPNS